VGARADKKITGFSRMVIWAKALSFLNANHALKGVAIE
jgi:hypothetical protein